MRAADHDASEDGTVEPLEQVIEPVSAPERRIAAGGWRRGAVGIALGIAAGALVAIVTPRDRTATVSRDRTATVSRDRTATGDRGAPRDRATARPAER